MLYESERMGPIAAFVGRSKDSSILTESSSGGIFPLLARSIIEYGGYVFGCAWGEDLSACHVEISTIAQIPRLSKSKYVQSKIGNMFVDVKNRLTEGKPVLFSGTPCQVAGLKNYLSKEYENLITVDFICHGVPSPLAFQKYIMEKEMQYGAKVDRVVFRDKTKGWKELCIRIEFTDGSVYSLPAAKDVYYRAFLSNLSLNEVCGRCVFNSLPRTSDITLGDFWGVEKYHESFADNKGVSCIVVNSEKGRNLVNCIQAELQMEETVPEKILQGNPFLNGHCTLHKRRKKFFELLQKEPFGIATAKCLKPTAWEWFIEVARYKLGLNRS